MKTLMPLVAAIAVCLVAAGHTSAPSNAAPFLGDPSDESVTVTGVVELVREQGVDGCALCEACSDCRATHLVVRTGTRDVEVHLAPAWYLARIAFAPVAGDVVRVDGTRTTVPKGRCVAAHEITVGARRIRLRDENGLPLWRRLLTDASSATERVALADNRPASCGS